MNAETKQENGQEFKKRGCGGRGRCRVWGKLLFLVVVGGGIAGWVAYFL